MSSAVCALAALLALAPANGAERDAREQARRAAVASDLGRFDEAATLYEKAYRRFQDPELLWELAEAHRRGGHPDRAATVYGAYLRHGAVAHEADAKVRLGEIEAARGTAAKPGVPAGGPAAGTATPAPASAASAAPAAVSALTRYRAATVRVFLLGRPRCQVDQGQRHCAPLLGHGSGLALRAGDGLYVLTNRHVAEPRMDESATAKKKAKRPEPLAVLAVQLPGQPAPVPARTIWKHALYDLALLQVVPGDARPAFEAAALTPEIGHIEAGATMTLIGYPVEAAQEEPASADGTCGGTWRGFDDGKAIELTRTSAPLNEGNSGGPAIDARGRLVGLAVAHISAAQGLGLLIPAPIIEEALAALDAGPDEPRPTAATDAVGATAPPVAAGAPAAPSARAATADAATRPAVTPCCDTHLASVSAEMAKFFELRFEGAKAPATAHAQAVVRELDAAIDAAPDASEPHVIAAWFAWARERLAADEVGRARDRSDGDYRAAIQSAYRRACPSVLRHADAAQRIGHGGDGGLVLVLRQECFMADRGAYPPRGYPWNSPMPELAAGGGPGFSDAGDSSDDDAAAESQGVPLPMAMAFFDSAVGGQPGGGTPVTYHGMIAYRPDPRLELDFGYFREALYPMNPLSRHSAVFAGINGKKFFFRVGAFGQDGGFLIGLGQRVDWFRWGATLEGTSPVDLCRTADPGEGTKSLLAVRFESSARPPVGERGRLDLRFNYDAVGGDCPVQPGLMTLGLGFSHWFRGGVGGRVGLSHYRLQASMPGYGTGAPLVGVWGGRPVGGSSTALELGGRWQIGRFAVFAGYTLMSYDVVIHTVGAGMDWIIDPGDDPKKRRAQAEADRRYPPIDTWRWP